MKSIQELERLAGPRKAKPKPVVEINDPQVYIATGMQMMLDHIMSFQNEPEKLADQEDNLNLNYGRTAAKTQTQGPRKRVVQQATRVSTAHPKRKRKDQLQTSQELEEAQPLDMLLKKTQSKMDLLQKRLVDC